MNASAAAPTAMMQAVRSTLRRYRCCFDEAFPPVEGNSVQPLENRDRYFRSMLDRIEGARRTVDVDMYLWHRDMLGMRFVAALRRAVGRGVAVRVLADAWGAAEVTGEPLRKLAESGADVRVFNPFRFRLLHRFYHRTHRKLLVVDDACAFTGGAGFSDHFSGGKLRERPWHDRMYEFRGPVVDQLVETFVAAFERWHPLVDSLPHRDTTDARSRDAAERPGGTRAQVMRSWPDGRDFQALLLRAVRSAEQRIWIGTPYFLPMRSLRYALRKASRRGVDVQLVLPAVEGANLVIWYGCRRHYGRVLRAGGRIHEFGPEFYHAKVAIVDDTLALVGSSNLDAWSWRRNAELDVALTVPATVRQIATCWEQDRDHAHEVTYEEHRTRSIAQRVFERFVGWFDHLL